ncbi:MAG: hypothetical protein ACKOXO_11415 [Cyanobium sp.]
MTTPWASEFSLSATSALAVLAAALLVFVSGGVLYLSTVEWRDRRRRQASPSAPMSPSRGGKRKGGLKSAKRP